MPGIVVGIDVSEFNKKLSAAQHAVNGLSSVMKVVPREAQSAGSALSDTGKNAQNAAGNIKSLAKQLLGLVGAYKAVDSAMNFAKRGVEFNSSIESSRIGIASIINSMATLQNSQGQVLEGAEKYAAAQEVAAQMMKRIQILGLETTATTQDLVQGVQSVIGPALQAGMRLEQIPDFAVAAAQAMQTMGIPLQQMRTELDALLTGRVNLAQDLLAPRLFSDKGAKAGEYIQQLAKEGKLLDEIMRRLDTFRVAGADVALTFTGMMSNLDEALDVVSGKVASGLTGKLKETISTVQELFVSTKNGSTGISSDFEHIADLLTEIETGIGSALLDTVKSLGEGIKSFNEYLGETGSSNFLEDVSTAAKTAIVALGGLYLARKRVTIADKEGAEQQVQFSTALKNQIVSLASYKKELLSAAQAEVQEAQAARQAYEAATKTAEWQKMAARNASNLARAREAEAETANRVAVAEANLARVQNMSTFKAAGIGILTKGLAGLKNAASSVLRLFGGPWGLALTAATAVMGYFATRQDDAARATELHTKAEENYQAAVKGATDETGKLTGKLSALQQQRLEMAKVNYENEWALRIGQLQKKYEELSSKAASATSILSSGNAEDIIPQGYLDTLDGMISLLKSGQLSAEDFGNNIAELRKKALDAGYANSTFVKTLDELAKPQDGLIETLTAIAEKLGLIGQASGNAAGGVNQAANTLNSAAQSFERFYAAFEKVSGLGKRGGKDVSEEETIVTKGRASISGTNASKEASTVQKRKDNIAYQAELRKQIAATNDEAKKAALSNELNLVAKGYAQIGQASGGASKTATAQEGIKKLREEIDRLNGTSVQAVTSLDQKLREIEKTGKEAGLSAQGIADLRNEYQDAFKANTLKDFNKEILQLQGNTSALREIEIGDTVKEWGQKLTAAGLESDEVTAKTEELKGALEKQWNTKNLQVTADFYKQLSEYSGDFNLSMEYQNLLIEIQGQNWILNGIAMNDVIEMQKLMRQEAARDPWSGMLRGMRKWSGEATNLGKQVETSLTSAFDNASDALADFVTTGKLNFADLANSIISDLARIAARQAIGGIVGGLVSGLGNMFGSSYTDTAKNMVNYIPGVNFSAKGNVFSGGNISDYSNSIVSRPTLFSYGSQLQPFARGAGLMGEAGREAILPLARTSTGNLGVYATFEQRQTQRDLDRLKASMNTVEAIVLSHKTQREAAAAPAPEVKVNIINNSNAKVTQETRTDNYGNKTIDVMVGDAAARQLNRPGTTLNKSLYQQTGLQRRAIRR